VIRSAIRSSDVVARSGEAEFALILPEATSDRILSKADMVRSKVQERVCLLDDRKTDVTCSVGLASMEILPPGGTRPDQVKSAEDLLGMANMALTRARGSGSGRVVVFGG
jgi:diguanylate cyclase (GGDEF)-like protein